MQDYTEIKKTQAYLNRLCSVKPNRQTGSPGNRQATDFCEQTIKPWGFKLDTTPFDCIDFDPGESLLSCDGNSFEIQPSPFSLGCDINAELVTVTTIQELEICTCEGKILLLKGEICAEQLMPKNFVFYNPDHHKKIYALLEQKKPAAIITATGKNPELVGGEYPFPMIEDGDFDIPSIYCRDVVGEEIGANTGKIFKLKSTARRIPSTACNVIARKNADAKDKIVICAHIDARRNSPGASDDASGVVVLLLLAEMLKDYNGGTGIEIIAFNGEDYYSAGGQMDYLKRYRNEMSKIKLAINIDDIGYIKGRTAFSLYECPDAISNRMRTVFGEFKGLMQGEPWYQGDHMIFVQNKIPAIAFTAEFMKELMAEITHTPKDTPDIVDCSKLVETARALQAFIST
jgi:aminopeptidase YwaD